MPRPALGWSLVVLQAALIVGAVAAPGPLLYTATVPVRLALTLLAVLGMVLAAVSLLGLGRGLTASPVPREEGALITDGMFGVVRHPTYASLGLGIAAFALASGSAGRLVFTALLFLLFAIKARWEERMLAERFPVYPAYAARVPRFIPAPWRRGARRPPTRTRGDSQSRN